eukprot:1491040-Lingulodinium_polyedra.AAC.1
MARAHAEPVRGGGVIRRSRCSPRAVVGTAARCCTRCRRWSWAWWSRWGAVACPVPLRRRS